MTPLTTWQTSYLNFNNLCKAIKKGTTNLFFPLDAAANISTAAV